jgi:hypothetical protein
MKFLIYAVIPLVMLYAIIASFLCYDIKALLISSLGTIIIMFMIGRVYESNKL